MFTRILVPLDGTTHSATALPAARTVARTTGAELMLVRVVPPATFSGEFLPVEDARAYLSRIAAELARGETRVKTRVRRGDNPAQEIVGTAESKDADLIVMATHGREGFARIARGSVADGVLTHSPVPVMLLRPGGRRLEHVRTLLVPVDGTPGATLALSNAVPLAQATGAKIVLVQVVIPSAYYYTQGLTMVDLGSDEAALAAAQEYVEGLARRMEEADVSAMGSAVLGRPSERIVRAAEAVGADLVVMSTHGLTGPMRTLLGSVADEVVRAAHQPVLLVRQRHGAAVDAPAGAKRQVVVV